MKFIIIAAVFMLIARATRTARLSHKKPHTAIQPTKTALRIRAVLKAGEWTAGILSAGTLLAAGVYQTWGPFWPIPPEIKASQQLDGASLILPFEINSKSNFFPATNANVSCSVNLLYVMDVNKKTILLRDARVVGGSTAVDNGVDYPCNANILAVRADGSLRIGFDAGQFLQTRPGVFFAPLKVLKMCVEVVGTYNTWLQKDQKLPKIMFQWPSVPNGHEWANHKVIFDTESDWIPPESTPGSAYALRRVVDGQGHFLPKALTCDEPT